MAQSAKQQKEKAEREARVIELHARGVTFEQIAAQGIPGIGSKQQAHKLWKSGIEKAPKIAATEARFAENQKLDNLERKLNSIVINRDTETKDVIRTAQVLVGVYKRRADLNGLDIRPTDAPGGGVQTVLVDASVLLKTRRAPGEEDFADGTGDDLNG